jgi:hypothetical protein
MRHVSAVVFGLLLVSAASTFAAEVTGVLVDEACYVKEKAAGSNSQLKGEDVACAQSCAKNGNSVALVTEKGDVYQVMAMGALSSEKNAKLVPHMTHKVVLTGDVVDGKDGKKMIHATALKMVQ